LTSAVIIAIEGKNYPVDILYADTPVSDVVTAAAEAALNIHMHEGDGDILIFLHGAEAIEQCCGA
jgi:HrpA-like RNA helicase